jgi:HD-GYP domain-containing protein (c-di-GMP phosphodiesterase class II)
MDLGSRELLVELGVGGAFLVAATALAALAPAHTFELDSALLVFVGLVLGARVVFEVGSCYTMPIQLAFVPALFVLPPASVPLLVAGALVVARSMEVAQGQLHMSRILNAFGDAWFSLGPALVLVLAGSPAANHVGAGILGLALASQYAGDAITSRVREWLHGEASLREQLAQSAWIYLVDLLLSPVGFAIALAATDEPAAVALAWPLFLLLAVFAHERDDRLASLLELSDAYRGTARVLGEVVEHDDAYTGVHLRGVAELAVEVAGDLNLDDKRRRLVEFGALLHDVGKIAIAKEIINKPGPLDGPEWQVIRTHTIEGQRMLANIGGFMRDVGEVVRSSHERFDGAGYPDGLAGERIPLESRIVFCCDAYNAMTTDRPYRDALPMAVAIAELRDNSGTQFDPRVIDALLARVQIALDAYPA